MAASRLEIVTDACAVGRVRPIERLTLSCRRADPSARRKEAVAHHVSKGRQVGVEGELRVSEWQPDNGPKRYDVKVHARRVDFLAKPRSADEPQPAAATS
jgi:hypothetical protein